MDRTHLDPPDLSVGELTEILGGRLTGEATARITGATHDSRLVEPGWLFCAVPGEHHDGAEFAAAAVTAGASAVLARTPLEVGVPTIVVEDVRAEMPRAAAVIHGNPASSLTLIGVTGTNGKTTVAAMLGDVLRGSNLATEVVGTLSGARTTPEATDLQALLAGFRDAGITHVVMEVSSHALSLHRVDCINFDVAVFTNLGRDHLDFHGNPEAYFAAKARLFSADMCRQAIVNLDDVHGRLLSDTTDVPVSGFSVDQLASLQMDGAGSAFEWRGHSVALPLPGRHNVSNALAAAEAAVAIGLSPAAVASALADLAQVPGRFEIVAGPTEASPSVVVDYAHTPDALENVLGAAGELLGPGGRLVVVFGCGGDRDREKRPLMGEVATRTADRVVVTSDNPRSEDPMGIIEQVLRGCDDSVVVEPDRRTAIRVALSGRGPADVVVIAGKGHETGQDFGDRVEPFDDRVVASEELRERGGGR